MSYRSRRSARSYRSQRSARSYQSQRSVRSFYSRDYSDDPSLDSYDHRGRHTHQHEHLQTLLHSSSHEKPLHGHLERDPRPRHR